MITVYLIKENEVLLNEKYKHGIRKLNDSFLDCGGSKKAIAVIDTLLNKVKL
ncbi:glycosyl transferase [Bacillus sp. MYb209]|nr:glycosyl transferase [Bacillus sp. MYb209]